VHRERDQGGEVKAIVVGGTGPTGPFLVNGLIERGYDVTIFHRGTHEIPEIPVEVAHIHGDPHFQETIDEALAGRSFDLAVVTYGRVRFLAHALVGKVGRFVGVGGVGSYRGYRNAYALSPPGMPVAVSEEAPLVASEEELEFAYRVAQTERFVLKLHPTAAYFRYPLVYGPYQLRPREWCVIRRILDKRPHIIVPDSGLLLNTHGYAGNLAHAVLMAVDKPNASAGQIYNCGDVQQFSLQQTIEVIAQVMDHKWEIVNMPHEAARPAYPYVMNRSPHHRAFDLTKIRTQLGYADIYPVEEALSRTVKWYLQHQPERGGEIEAQLHDPFDYDGEDRLIASYKRSMIRLAEIPFDIGVNLPHPYAHPKLPGQTRDQRDR
jgi:nucleoside-diphosphate-sugar epimerase